MQQLERVPRAASAALLQIASSPSDASQATLRLFDVVVRATPSGGGRRGAAGAWAGPKLADVENKNDAVIVSAGLISLAMTSSLPATAASHRALRKFAKVRTEREIAAAAATASDAAAEARESAALASQSRRGAASAAAKALVESSQEWARAVAEGALELASILEATGDGGGVDPWYEASRALDPSSSSSSSSSSPPPPPSAAVRRVATASCRVLADVASEASAPVPTPTATALLRAALACADLLVSASGRGDDGGSPEWDDVASATWRGVATSLGAPAAGDVANEYARGRDAARVAAANARVAADEIVRARMDAASAASASLAAFAARHALRSSSRRAVARRLADVATSAETDDARRDAAFALVASVAPCPVASRCFVDALPALAAAAVSRRAESVAAAAVLSSLRAGRRNEPGAAPTREPSPREVIVALSKRYPKGEGAFRSACARAAMDAAESASSRVACEAALRMFEACAKRDDGDDVDLDLDLDFRGGGGGDTATARRRAREKKRAAVKITPRRLDEYALRCAKLFARASENGGPTSVIVAAADAVAAACARAQLATRSPERYARSISASISASVALSCVALPSDRCVRVGVRLAKVAFGLDLASRATAGEDASRQLALIAAAKKVRSISHTGPHTTALAW